MTSGARAKPGLDALEVITNRFDPKVVELGRRTPRIRLRVLGADATDAILSRDGIRLEPVRDGRPDAELIADPAAWEAIAGDVRGGMQAYRRGELTIRHDLHLGVGFLAATSGRTGPAALQFRHVDTTLGRLSTVSAGTGPAVIAIHGLGATKQSMLATVAGLAPSGFRVTAVDLPGFGDSDKPFPATYDARFFSRWICALLDALELERAHLVGNSLGGRVCLEVALRHPERVDHLGLLAPSLAWRRNRPWRHLLRAVRPELGIAQPTPRPVVEAIVNQVVPGNDPRITAGVDEFLRSYLTPRGRVAFYAAARQIYLEEPEGPNGFWPRLRTLSRPALFVWGRSDTLVPIGFARHVTATVPAARHLELDCGHLPQLERPQQTHDALAAFFSAADH